MPQTKKDLNMLISLLVNLVQQGVFQHVMMHGKVDFFLHIGNFFEIKLMDFCVSSLRKCKI